jgi:uncharacterized protein with PIN domain
VEAAHRPVGASVGFRFYAELGDFLAPAQRGRCFDIECPPGATVKHMIEALGVPHTEVELVLVDGESVGFERRLVAGERVAVYPKFEAFDIASLLRVRAAPLRVTRFLADAHLGALARLLRMAGFDTHYDNRIADAEVVRLACAEQRIVLSRDRDLLMRREISHGCYVHAQAPREQLSELFARLDLAASARPFSLCTRCNAPLQAVDKREVEAALPPRVRERQQSFSRCPVCRRVYWEGSHWQRMRELLASLGA